MDNKNFPETSDRVLVWTVQAPPVISCIQKNGFSTVKKAYIEKKYEDSAWIFQEAYGFFINRAETLIPRPEEVESPFWLFLDQAWLYPGPGDYLLELCIQRDRLILFEREKWQKILNLSYIGASREEEQAFAAELERMGITPYESFASPFYPALRARIRKSWERLFTLETKEPKALQAACWELRREDIVSCRLVSGKEERI